MHNFNLIRETVGGGVGTQVGSRKQETKRLYSEGKQHQPQSSRTCSVHDKALQTKVQVYAPTTSFSNEGINSFCNDVGETTGKPNHYTLILRTNRMKTKTGAFRL